MKLNFPILNNSNSHRTGANAHMLPNHINFEVKMPTHTKLNRHRTIRMTSVTVKIALSVLIHAHMRREKYVEKKKNRKLNKTNAFPSHPIIKRN